MKKYGIWLAYLLLSIFVLSFSVAQQTRITLRQLATTGAVSGQNITFNGTNAVWGVAALKFPVQVRANGSAPINTTQFNITNSLQIQPNQLLSGDSFRIVIFGTHTSSVAATATFTVRLGSAGNPTDPAIYTFAIPTSGTGTNIPYQVTFNCNAFSGGTQCIGFLLNQGTGISSQTYFAGSNTSASFNIALGGFLNVSLVTNNVGSTSSIRYTTTEFLR